MKTLLLLRHAKSSHAVAHQVDRDRPLNDRGNRDAPRVGELLVEKQLVPDAICSSTATRARMTAEKVAKACGFQDDIRLEDELYLAGPAMFVTALKAVPDERRLVLVVGHNPGLEEYLFSLIGTDETLPTAALAQVSLPIQRWSDLTLDTRGTLTHVWRPRESDVSCANRNVPLRRE